MDATLEQITQWHREHIHQLQEDTWVKLLILVDLDMVVVVVVVVVAVDIAEITLPEETVVVTLQEEDLLLQGVIDMILIMMIEIDTEIEIMTEIDTMMTEEIRRTIDV